MAKTLADALSWWKYERTWPMDTAEYVFLARAVMQIGAKLYGDEWTGDEPTIESVPMPPIFPPKNGWVDPHVRKLLSIAQPNLPPRVVKYGPYGALPGQELTAEEWRLALAVWRDQYQVAEGARDRFGSVQKEIAAQCVAVMLKSVMRPCEGGRFFPIPDWHWSTERLWSRFARCQMNPNRPFDYGIAGDGYGLIFLTRASLDAYLSSGDAAVDSKQHVITAASEKRCRDWLIDLMTQHEKPPRAKGKLQTEALSQFGTGTHAFRRAWNDAIAKDGTAQLVSAGASIRADAIVTPFQNPA
jgi:hypothetical protein